MFPIERIDCALRGIPLSSLDERIRVTDVVEHPAPLRRTWLPDGIRDSLSVTVRFRLLDEDDAQRRTLMQSVLAWARDGGALTLPGRTGQQLHVAVQSLPEMRIRDWQEELSLTFAALRDPYWEGTSASAASTTATTQLSVPGTAPHAPVDVTVTNLSNAEITTIDLQVGVTSMTFEGVLLGAGGTFTLMVQEGLLTARIGSASVLHHRTAMSDDLLLAPCGASAAVTLSADGYASATFSTRGRYL